MNSRLLSFLDPLVLINCLILLNLEIFLASPVSMPPSGHLFKSHLAWTIMVASCGTS